MPTSKLKPNSSANVEAPAAERRLADSLSSAMLLAFTGGSLDAFIYLNHGHVFAAAMTGNGILFGIAVLHRDPMEGVRHFLPILAFLIGVFLAKFLEQRLKRHAVAIGLCCEISVLFIASWLPGSFPDLAFVPLVAVVAAYQVASFRTADTYSYNSTFMTGNLRTAIDGLYAALFPTSVAEGLAGRRKFRELSQIVATFLSGAIVGAILAPRMLNHTLLIVDLPLVVVLVLALQRSRKELRSRAR